MYVSTPAQPRGLSPHIRGKRSSRRRPVRSGGSIPAYTGETKTDSWSSRGKRVYPRIYGGNDDFSVSLGGFRGLSPHIRGKRAGYRHSHGHIGSIPAYTGETADDLAAAVLQRVYPRIYGGNIRRYYEEMGIQGLSPHIRGKLLPHGRSVTWRGSIPAYTGETGMPPWLATVC